MTRGALSLLLLLTSWLLSLPQLSAATAPARATVVAASHDEANAGTDREHVAAQSAMPQVPRAPLLARLPALPSPEYRPRPIRAGVHRLQPPDRRAALLRVQARRRVPRLGGGEPPWC